MLFRAAFWIGVVALLLPRGSGSIAISGGPSANGAAGITAAAEDDFQDIMLQRLAVVKADIEAAERIRAAGGS